MKAETQGSMDSLLASGNPEEIRAGLELVKREIARVGAREARPQFEKITALFTIDPFDRPDLMPVLEEAISLTVGFGDWVIPHLLEKLDDGDLKAQMSISTVLGRLGAEAIPHLKAAHESADDERRAFLVYALGKIKSPRVVEVVDLAIAAARSQDMELRDTGTRAIGKLVESVELADLEEVARREFFAALWEKLAESNAGIRAKAVRSLGKMARYGFLAGEERSSLRVALLRILGRDEAFDWDRAYAVRREAEEALQHI